MEELERAVLDMARPGVMALFADFCGGGPLVIHEGLNEDPDPAVRVRACEFLWPERAGRRG